VVHFPPRREGICEDLLGKLISKSQLQGYVLFRWDSRLKPVRIGTRGSKLALWQAEWVAGQLRQRGLEAQLVIISTQGDVTSGPLSQSGGQGLFTKEIQRELLAENVDVAVHSLKDLPTEPVAGLSLAAVPSRETTADCLISKHGLKFQDLPAGARIGTGSARRAAQLRHWRSDVEILDIRGNVDSRLRKLEEGQYEAIVLAAAGLTRLKLIQHVTEFLSIERMLPAVGQGALGLECRSSDSDTISALRLLDDQLSHHCVLAERELLRQLQAGCLAPVAAMGTIVGQQLNLKARVIALDGSRAIQDSISGSIEQAVKLGRLLADRMLGQGAAGLIQCSRSTPPK
jgi:hydroxymethylbilane synthase